MHPIKYTLVTQWHLAAPIEPVWDALMTSEQWPKWWKYVRQVVDIQPGDAQGLNSVKQFTWSSRFPYRLRFEVQVIAMEQPYWLEAVASGDLNGIGSWKLEQMAESTRVTYYWSVSTKKPWMNVLAPLLAPAFAWNHDQVMRAGGKGLARHLGVALLDFQGSGSHKND